MRHTGIWHGLFLLICQMNGLLGETTVPKCYRMAKEHSSSSFSPVYDLSRGAAGLTLTYHVFMSSVLLPCFLV